MRVLGAIVACAMLGACAFPSHVERFGVEYNTALAGMNNEQTLLNILRARDGMPTHFTSVSQFRGNINLTAAASINSQLRGEGLTQAIASGFSNTTATTASTTTNMAAPGAAPSTSTVAGTVLTPVATGSTTSTVAEGVDLYTPQVTGQLVTGTGFDVAVFDTQKFFQGITTAIPFPTLETLLNQGIDNRVITALTVARVDFRASEARFGYSKGEIAAFVINDPTRPSEAREFAKFVNCYELGAGIVPAEATNVVALSRITRGSDGKPVPLALDKVTLIDGQKVGLSAKEGIGSDPAKDDQIFLTRLTADKRVARLSQRSLQACTFAGDVIRKVKLPDSKELTVAVPSAPSPRPIYLGEGFLLVYDPVGKVLAPLPVDLELTLRSPEGLFRYLGAYLRDDNGATINIDGQPLFSITAGPDQDALAEARYRGKVYSLVNQRGAGTRNAQIFTLLQQLINLHKEATERPTAIPVRAIP